MKTKLLILVQVLLLLSCKSSKESQETKVKEYSIDQIMNNESLSGASFSQDMDKIVLSSNKSGIYNVYELPIRGGEMTPITNSDSTSFRSLSYFPEDDRILITADNNGDENYHLYVRNSDNQIIDLTPENGARNLFYKWSKDKKHFYYGSNKRDPRFFDGYKMSVESYESEMLFKNEDGYTLSGISDDESYFGLTKTISREENNLFIYNTKSEEMTKVNSTKSSNSLMFFSKDNSKVFYTSDDFGEFSYLKEYDIENKTSKSVYQKSWDITNAYLSEEGKYLIVYSNEDGKNNIDILDPLTMKSKEHPALSGLDISNVNISRDESWMSIYIGRAGSPYNLYSYNFETEELNKLSSVLNKEIDADDLVEAEVVRFESFDGVQIPSIFYRPKQASTANKVPGIVLVHGGPGGQSRQVFNPIIQYLVNHGYAVMAVNNRGSSGYGKTFFQMDDRKHGDEDLRDCIEAKEWMASQDFIEKDKIGIMGGSYGGYMTMAALTFTPEEFKVGVNLFGVTNWMRTLKSIPPYWEAQRKALYIEMGDPFSKDSIRLKEISPLFHTQNITKPLIVLQGSQDPRVLQIESDEIVEAVRNKGVPVEYVLFDDEGHGFVKKKNQIEAYSKILGFLDTYLK
jgi:dipeptidyl aminopeptidase/acylaminoacyl peptidase